MTERSRVPGYSRNGPLQIKTNKNETHHEWMDVDDPAIEAPRKQQEGDVVATLFQPRTRDDDADGGGGGERGGILNVSHHHHSFNFLFHHSIEIHASSITTVVRFFEAGALYFTRRVIDRIAQHHLA